MNDIVTFIEQAQKLGVTVYAAAALKRLYDLVQPAFSKRLSTPVEVDAYKKLAEVEIEVLQKQLAALKKAQEEFPDATFALKDGKVEVSIPPMAERAITRLLTQVEREQSNLESIIEGAAATLKTVEAIGDGKPDEDWFARFVDAARFVSDEQLQIIWSRILAGEVTSRGFQNKRVSGN